MKSKQYSPQWWHCIVDAICEMVHRHSMRLIMEIVLQLWMNIVQWRIARNDDYIIIIIIFIVHPYCLRMNNLF